MACQRELLRFRGWQDQVQLATKAHLVIQSKMKGFCICYSCMQWTHVRIADLPPPPPEAARLHGREISRSLASLLRPDQLVVHFVCIVLLLSFSGSYAFLLYVDFLSSFFGSCGFPGLLFSFCFLYYFFLFPWRFGKTLKNIE